MKKKRYTKPVVIDLGQQSLNDIVNGQLTWERHTETAEHSDTYTNKPADACCEPPDDDVKVCEDNQDSGDKKE